MTTPILPNTFTGAETDFTRKVVGLILPNTAGPVQRAMAAGYAARRARLFKSPPLPVPAITVRHRVSLVEAQRIAAEHADAERLAYLASWDDQPPAVCYDHFVNVDQAIPEPEPRRPTIREIILAICEKHDVHIREVRSVSRTKRIAFCRMECAYEIRRTVLIRGRPISLPEIARHLGGLDHTTVLYGIRKHAQRNGLEVPA